ncbi:ferric-chelate reductase Frp1 [Vanrija albida]|uniref:ferric-chelate reductase (NADPH) n=1 Tax=Vanrija albida TaxID=181172 RepID=A0ABR3Q396_9TREE
MTRIKRQRPDGTPSGLTGQRPTGGLASALDSTISGLTGQRPTNGVLSAPAGATSQSGDRPSGLTGVRPTGGLSAQAATPTSGGQPSSGGRGPMTGQRPTGGVDCVAGDSDHGRCDGTGESRQAHEDRAAWLTWWVVAGVVALLAGAYLLRVWRARAVKRRVLAQRKAKGATDGGGKTGGYQAAASTTFANLAHVRVFPLWLYANSTANEWFWTAAYAGTVVGLGCYGGKMPGQPVAPINVMGYIAYSQVPLIIGLATRNNLVSALTGVSYEKLNYLHRAAGRVCVLTSSIHSIGWASKSAASSAFAPGSYIFNTGMVAWVALLAIYASSFRIVRAWAYEAFLALHVAMALMFIIGCLFHWVALWGYLAAGLIIWGGSRVLGLVRLAYLNALWRSDLALVELLEPDVMRVTVPRDRLKWHAGQHAYLTMPSISWAQQHPFTMANASGDAVFLVRAQRGFTRRLRDRLIGTKSRTRCLVEGPYGTVHALHHYDTIVLVAGGTGVSFATALLLDVAAAARRGESAVSAVHLVWNVRAAENLAWVAALLNEAVAGVGIKIKVDVFVTRSTVLPRISLDDAGSSSEAGPSSALMVEEKKTSTFGLSPEAARTITLHAGRSPLDELIAADVAASAQDGAGVCVTVCGPTALALSTRRAVLKTNTAGAVLRGQAPVTFHAEAYGW